MTVWKHLLAALVLGVAPLATGPVTAQAQSVTSADLQAMAAWSGQGTRAIQGAMAPFQQLPQPPQDMTEDAVRLAWVAQARAWLVTARDALSASRKTIADLPPPPRIAGATQMDGAVSGYLDRVPAFFNGLEKLYDTMEATVVALERNDAEATLKLAVAMMDAGMLPLTSGRDINDMTAAALGPEHPQGYWLRSVARSYDALLADVGLARASLANLGAAPDIYAFAESIEAAVAEMNREIVGGRAATRVLTAQVAASRPRNEDEAALLPKLNRMLRSYGPAFDREQRIAELLAQIAARYRTPGFSYDMEDSVLLTLSDRVIALDAERVADQLARTNALSAP